jgi:sugar/nucleoside kinase (ribokinase family)
MEQREVHFNTMKQNMNCLTTDSVDQVATSLDVLLLCLYQVDYKVYPIYIWVACQEQD